MSTIRMGEVGSLRGEFRRLAEEYGHRAVALLLLQESAVHIRLTHIRGGEPERLAKAQAKVIDAFAETL
jgi:hypothetical protein